MGFIIRNRLMPGDSVVDGNNPYTIQGHHVSTKVVGQQTGIRDFMDLTDHILAVPRELSHYRYDSPLMGGSLTVKNHSGPVNDYLATQYLSEKPEQGYMGPENRPAEIPEITIGKGGTFDVALASSIWGIDTVKTLDSPVKIKEKLISGVYYNLTDFDDPNAPALPVKLEDPSMYSVVFPSPKGGNKVNLAHVTTRGRIVGFVAVNNTGREFVNRARGIFEKAGGHPCEIRQAAAWFELQIIEEPVNQSWVYPIFGAKFNEGDKQYRNIYTTSGDRGYLNMRIPAERVFPAICTNSQTVDANKNQNLAEYVYVPFWDIREINTTCKANSDTKAEITVRWNGKDTKSTVNFGMRRKTYVSDVRIVPSRPIALYAKDVYGALVWEREEHPFFPVSVVPYFRTTFYPPEGGIYLGDLEIAGYSTEAVQKWAPNMYVTLKLNHAVGNEVSLPLAYIPRMFMTAEPVVIEKGKDVMFEVPFVGPTDGVEFTSTGDLPTGVTFDADTVSFLGKPKVDITKNYTPVVTAKYGEFVIESMQYTLTKKSAVVKEEKENKGGEKINGADIVTLDVQLPVGKKASTPADYVITAVDKDGISHILGEKEVQVLLTIKGPTKDNEIIFTVTDNTAVCVTVDSKDGQVIEPYDGDEEDQE